jgi:hypothetical protein
MPSCRRANRAALPFLKRIWTLFHLYLIRAAIPRSLGGLNAGQTFASNGSRSWCARNQLPGLWSIGVFRGARAIADVPRTKMKGVGAATEPDNSNQRSFPAQTISSIKQIDAGADLAWSQVLSITRAGTHLSLHRAFCRIHIRLDTAHTSCGICLSFRAPACRHENYLPKRGSSPPLHLGERDWLKIYSVISFLLTVVFAIFL